MTIVSDHETAHQRQPVGDTAATVPIADTSNDSLIIRLHMTVNHLSRWLTPVLDEGRLLHSPRIDEPSVMTLLRQMRDHELVVFPKFYAIANYTNPDLDRLPDPLADARRMDPEFDRSVMTVLAEFRRLRQSTCSLLRALPDSAWARVGTSRMEHDWQIRTLGEALVQHDVDQLYAIDVALWRSGVRQNISSAAGAHLDELLRLVPVTRISG